MTKDTWIVLVVIRRNPVTLKEKKILYSKIRLAYLQILYFSLVLFTSHPVNNSQLLLKLEIIEKLRLATFHKRQHRESVTLKLVHNSSGEMSVL
jgi:hypothetical protein